MSDYTQLTTTEEKSLIIEFYFIGGAIIAISTLICIVLRIESSKLTTDENKNPYYSYAMHSMLALAIGSIFLYIIKAFFVNNLVIPWDYTRDIGIVTGIDSVGAFLSALIVIAFYYGFTYHIQSIFYKHNNDDTLSLSIKIWMIFALVTVFVATSVGIIADFDTVDPSTEIGVTPDFNIFVTVYFPHEGSAHYGKVAFAIVGILDAVYFIILMYFYIAKLRKVSFYDRKAAKPFILLFVSCAMFWILIILMVLDAGVKYIFGGLDIMTDIICLFLMFRSGEEMYEYLCGKFCNECCLKCIYGSKYRKVIDDNDNEEQLIINTDDQTPLLAQYENV